MRLPAALLVVSVPVLLAGGAVAWWVLRAPSPGLAESAGEEVSLPVPPVPPRIAEGEDYERCLAMLPTDPAGAAAMAEAWLPAGGDAARHCLALSKLELGEAAAGARLLEALATGSFAAPAARAQVFDQAAQAWSMAGQPAPALRAATRALDLSADDVSLLVDRATIEMALEQPEPAMRDLGRALDLDASRSDALVLRGSAWRALGRLDLAQDDIQRALERDPDDPEALLERGILRQRANDEGGARRDWERAISLDPDSSTADLAQQDLALLDAGPERQ